LRDREKKRDPFLQSLIHLVEISGSHDRYEDDWMLCHVVWYKMTHVSEVLTAYNIRVISLKMKAVRISET
jgi:hypothetical protein